MSGRMRWGPAAEELFRLDRPTAVSAGAGSGKTAALVELALRLLGGEATGAPVDPGAIAAITFTEKAGEELGERLRAALSERAAAAAGPAPTEARAWIERLHGMDRMAVGTIHGFCGRLLREHAPEAGVDPGFEVLEEEAAAALRAEAARAAVVAALDAGRPIALELCAGYGAGEHGLPGAVAALVRERASLGLGAAPEPAPSDPDPALAARRPLADAAAAALQARELCALVADAEERYAALKAEARGLDFDDLLARARDLLRGDAAVRCELRRRFRALLVDEYQDVNGVQEEIFRLLAAPDPRGAAEPAGPMLVAVGDPKQSIYRFRGADVAVFSGLLERLGRSPEGRVLRLAENHRSTPAILDLVNAVFERCMQPGAATRPFQIRFGTEDRLVPGRRGGMAPACEILVDGEEGSAAEGRAREARAIAARIQSLVCGAAGVAIAPGGGEPPRPPRHGDIALLFRRLTRISEYEPALREARVPYRLARGGGLYRAPEVRDLGELLASLFDPSDRSAWAALLRGPMCAVSDGTLFLLSRMGLERLGRREPDEVAEEIRSLWAEALATATASPTPTATPTANLSPTSTPTRTPNPTPSELSAEIDRLRLFLAEWGSLRQLRDRFPVHELLERAADRLDLEAVLLSGPDGERRAVNLKKALSLARRFAESGGTAPGFAARLRRFAAEPPREPEAELEAGDAVAILSVHQAKGLEWPVVFVPDLGARPRGDARRVALDGEGRICAAYFHLPGESFHPTPALERARQEGQLAEAAESRRLLYVALTRARDYLVLSGGGGRGGESWAAFVEAAALARPDLVSRIPLPEAGWRAVGPPAAAAGAPEPQALPPAPPRPAPPPPLPAVRLAVTDLAEYARCPRRHWLGRILGLPERDGAAGAAAGVDDPERATARGILAHAMLCEVDLAAPPLERRAQLAASAARRGHDPASPGVRRILGDVVRFLESPGGRRLAALARAGRLWREVPFLLRLEGGGVAPACYLAGTIDAVADGGGEATVLDFKYALARPGLAERYRLQLLAYALAASRALPGRRLRATLQFLRGAFASVDLTPSPAEMARFAEEAPALALGAHRGDGERRTPAELGRDEARCRAEGCGYAYRCYPRRIVYRFGSAAPTRAPSREPERRSPCP